MCKVCLFRKSSTFVMKYFITDYTRQIILLAVSLAFQVTTRNVILIGWNTRLVSQAIGHKYYYNKNEKNRINNNARKLIQLDGIYIRKGTMGNGTFDGYVKLNDDN